MEGALPVLADRLPDLLRPELRALFDTMRVKRSRSSPAGRAVDVEVTTEFRRSGPCTWLYTMRTQTR